MLEYLFIIAIGVFGTGTYFYNLKKKHTKSNITYKVNKMLDLPEFDELIVDFEEDEIQAKISKMND